MTDPLTGALHQFEEILDRKLETFLDQKLAENLAPLYKRLQRVEVDVALIKADVALTKADVALIKADVDKIKRATWDRLEEEDALQQILKRRA